MILGKIDNINIDSSLLRKIDMDCLLNRCNHKACCYEPVQLTEEDIAKISAIPKENIVKRMSDPQHQHIFLNHRFYDIDKKVKFYRTGKEEWGKCIFIEDKNCILEQINPDLVPIFCKSFPVILKNNELQIADYNITCLKEGLTPAYKSLKKEIIILTSPAFYEKLSALLPKYEGKINYYLASGCSVNQLRI